MSSNVKTITRGVSRTTATSSMESFDIIVNGFQPLTIITNKALHIGCCSSPRSASDHDVIKKNNLPIFKKKNSTSLCGSKQKVLSFKIGLSVKCKSLCGMSDP